MLAFAQPECRYDSPIDGTPITTWAQREDDLKRHGCQPYDPEQKTDYVNRIREREAALEKKIDEDVERAVEKMTTKERGRLDSEVREQGFGCGYHRSTKGD